MNIKFLVLRFIANFLLMSTTLLIFTNWWVCFKEDDIITTGAVLTMNTSSLASKTLFGPVFI